LKDQGQGVFLPYREFLEMWNQLTAQRETAPEPPPTESLLTSAEYSGRVDDEVAVMDAVLSVPAEWTSLEVTGELVEGFNEELTGEGAAQRRLVTVKFKGRVEGVAAFTLTGRLSRATPEADLACR